MVQKTMDLHVLSNLENVTIDIASFDFLMFKCGVNTFLFIIIIWMKVESLGMLLWDCLKCVKLSTTPWFYNSKHCWKKLNEFIV